MNRCSWGVKCITLNSSQVSNVTALIQLESNYSLFCSFFFSPTYSPAGLQASPALCAIWSIKERVTHTNAQRPVCPLTSDSEGLPDFIFETGTGEKTTEATEAFLPLSPSTTTPSRTPRRRRRLLHVFSEVRSKQRSLLHSRCRY